MKTAAHKRSSQELQAIRSQSITGLAPYLPPLVPVETEITEWNPYYLEWFTNGRKVEE